MKLLIFALLFAISIFASQSNPSLTRKAPPQKNVRAFLSTARHQSPQGVCRCDFGFSPDVLDEQRIQTEDVIRLLEKHKVNDAWVGSVGRVSKTRRGEDYVYVPNGSVVNVVKGFFAPKLAYKMPTSDASSEAPVVCFEREPGSHQEAIDKGKVNPKDFIN